MTVEPSPQWALIGDLIASRDSGDRAALHAALTAALEATNEAVEAITPLKVTVGDEFQGAYGRLGDALRATHLVRLALTGTAGVRFGLGFGGVRVLDAERGLEDGPAWWAARDAINEVERAARRPGGAALRTGLPALVGPGDRAAVLLIDGALAKLSDTARTILLTVITGGRRSDVADRLGITPQAVSHHVTTHQLALLGQAMTTLWEV